MHDPPPFVYLATLARTGSTLLGETLTRLPYSFIFFEPHLGKNYFALNKIDAEVFLQQGIDIRGFLRWRLKIAFIFRRLRPFGYPQDFMMRTFKHKLLPKLHTVVSQVGVKEIKHKGWENYLSHFPGMKVIVTARDPRDIYLSYLKLRNRGNLNWKKSKFRGEREFNPSTVAGELNREFKLQRNLMEKTDHYLLRYEDFCQNPLLIEEIKVFIQSPMNGTGSIGAVTSRHPKMIPEHQVHRDQITTKKVFNWKKISDQQKLSEANQVLDLMQEYANFWGYE